MSFFAELKRRNVFRVGIAYLIGAWLLLQIADVVLNNIAAPGWVFKAIMLVVGIGLPIALFFAWAFEMTPEGVKRESEVDRSQSITKTTAHKLDRTIIVILALALGYFAWDKFSAPTQPVAATKSEEQAIEKSIAVLPFVNMSADADNEYFSDGLSEELLNLLAKVDGLKVAARTSSFKFKNSEADIAEIGNKLNVAAVLEGSVRKSGNQARITAQLIKVDDGFHLWSETYDRDLDNIFEVQDEIARAIVDALKLPLLGHDAKPISSSVTDNFAAYDLYLLGRHHAREYSELGFERAIGYYQNALEIDPTFAPAYSGLADGYIFLADYGDLPQGEAQRLAQDAASKSLSLSPESPEAHASMGLLQDNLGRLSQAEMYFSKALQINPNYVNALLWYRNTLNSLYRFTEAMEIAERALSLDPLSMPTRRTYAGQLTNMSRFDEASREIQTFIAANPDDPTPYEMWGNQFQRRGLPQNSIPMYRNAHRLRPGDIYMAAQIVRESLKLDDADMVDYWLAQAQSRGTDGQWTRLAENMVLYARGQYPEFLRQIDQMLESQAGQPDLLGYRGAALLHLGQPDAAEDAFRSALNATGYVPGQTLAASQIYSAIQLANTLTNDSKKTERDNLLNQSAALLQQIYQSEPADTRVLLMRAMVASVKNDLPGVLQKLEEAVEKGFRDHWELIRNPVFIPWQGNPDFMAFHQGMLEAAAAMLREYQVNNPPAAAGGDS